FATAGVSFAIGLGLAFYWLLAGHELPETLTDLVVIAAVVTPVIATVSLLDLLLMAKPAPRTKTPKSKRQRKRWAREAKNYASQLEKYKELRTKAKGLSQAVLLAAGTGYTVIALDPFNFELGKAYLF